MIQEHPSGGFGSFLQLAIPSADGAETKRPYELFARHPIPEIMAAFVKR